MQFTFACPHCQSRIEADSGLVGQASQCPACRQALTVPQRELEPGVVLGGCRLEKAIGAGGMGQVFLATQLSMEREIAVKILPPRLGASEEAIRRFLHEARMAAKLDHSNIVTVHDAGEDDGFYYYAMSYVDGETLDARLESEGPFGEAEALTVVTAVAEALSYAWEKQRMLHRDIKPANIMITSDGIVKVLDFGLAKSVFEDRQLTMTGTILGTPNFMSPEQALAKTELDFRADIYSLGSTLYALLTGRAPFDGESVYAILSRLATEDMPSVQVHNPSLSTATARLVQNMTAKDPDDRYSSYEALLADIRRVRAGRPPRRRRQEAGPVPAARKTPNHVAVAARPKPRSRLTPVLIAAGVLTVLIAAVALLSPPSQRTKNSPPTSPPATAVPPAGGADATPPPGAEQRRRRPLAEPPEEQDDNASPARRPSFRERFGFRLRGPLAAPEGRVRREVERLEKELRQQAADGDLSGALERLRNYDGPWEEQTRGFRRRLTMELRRENGLGDGADKPVPEPPPTPPPAGTGPAPPPPQQIDAAIKAAVDALLAGRFKTVDATLQDIKPADPQLKHDVELLRAAGSLPDRVLASFVKDRGKEGTVQFREEGKLRVLVEAVEPPMVKAKNIINQGSATVRLAHNFTVDALSAAEKVKRLGPGDTPELQLMRGILACDIGRFDLARKYFSQVGGPIESLLLGGLPALEDERRVAQAEQAFGALLKQASLSATTQNPAELLAALYDRNYATVASQRIRQASTDFLQNYGATPTGRRQAELLKAMSRLGQQRIPADCRPLPTPPAPELKGLASGSEAASREQRAFAEKAHLPVAVVNRIGVAFQLLPPGSFTRPGGRKVTITRPFYIGRFEVTQKQWEQVMGANPASRKGPDLPVDNVSWNAATSMTAKLCELAKVPADTYRLPTEAEWEYACRAGTTGGTFFDPSRSHLMNFGNYLDRSGPDEFLGLQLVLLGLKDTQHTDGYRDLAPVGSFRPNAWGLYDTYGNVYEWCLDWQGPYPVGDVSDPRGPEHGLLKIQRGGSCIYRANECNSSHRHASPARDYTGGNILFGNVLGLRIVREIETDLLPSAALP